VRVINFRIIIIIIIIIIILAGGCSVSLISERKGTDPHWKHVRCTHFAS